MNIVHVAAHQDDEMWVTGTFLKYHRSGGHRLTFVCTTNGDKGGLLPDGHLPLEEAAAIRDKEMRAVAEEFDADYICLGAEDEFLFDSKEIRLKMIDTLRAVQADLIFTKYPLDYNLDHVITTSIVSQAAMCTRVSSMETKHPPLKHTPKIYYTDVGDGDEFVGTHYVSLSEEIFTEKMRLLSLHQSQMGGAEKGRWSHADDLRHRARALGLRVGAPFAEVFRPCLEARRIPLANMLT